mgnify:FL=1
MAETPLAQMYQKEIVPQLMERFSYNNRMQTPRLEKEVVN